MWLNVYNLLPDISGILLAAIGVALVFASDWVATLNKPIRWTAATVLLLLGAGGLRSSFVQHKENDKEQHALKGTIESYGPKWDYIVAHCELPELRAEAEQMKRGLGLAIPQRTRPAVSESKPQPYPNPSATKLTPSSPPDETMAAAEVSLAHCANFMKGISTKAKDRSEYRGL
jgi:hypothetical protein